MTVKIAKTRVVKTPIREHKYAAGVDFFIPEDFNDGKSAILKHGDFVVIPSGIYMKQSDLDCMKFENKSGIAVKKGLILGACVIDNEYQGELHINLIKATRPPCVISPGDKIVQGVFFEPKYRKVVEVLYEDLFDEISVRGEGKFGSTGTR